MCVGMDDGLKARSRPPHRYSKLPSKRTHPDQEVEEEPRQPVRVAQAATEQHDAGVDQWRGRAGLLPHLAFDPVKVFGFRCISR